MKMKLKWKLRIEAVETWMDGMDSYAKWTRREVSSVINTVKQLKDRVVELEKFKAQTDKMLLSAKFKAVFDRLKKLEAPQERALRVDLDIDARLKKLETFAFESCPKALCDLVVAAKEDRERQHRMLKRLRTEMRRGLDATDNWVGDLEAKVEDLNTPPSISDAEMAEVMREAYVPNMRPATLSELEREQAAHWGRIQTEIKAMEAERDTCRDRRAWKRILADIKVAEDSRDAHWDSMELQLKARRESLQTQSTSG